MGALGGHTQAVAPPTTFTRELLAGFLARDRAAERRVFERFRGPLLARAARSPVLARLRATVSAEDVLQEVWWRALGAGFLERFEDRGRGSLERALCAILDNTLADLARRHGTERRGALARLFTLSSELPLREAPAERPRDPTPTAAARYDELLAFCRAVLDDEQWAVWHPIDVGGLAPTELARRLGLSAAAARGRLFRARRALIEALGESHSAEAP